MRKQVGVLAWLFIFTGMSLLAGGNGMISKKTMKNIITELVETHGQDETGRIKKGVEQAASFWKEEDGSIEEFGQFCKTYFMPEGPALDATFDRLEANDEVLAGHFVKMLLDLKKPLHLDMGEILPIDMMFGQYNPSAHLTDDFFENKIAFVVLLNFPYYSLEEKEAKGASWSRKDWAFVRMGDSYMSRVPASVYQELSAVMTKADTYISEYNIFAGKLVDDEMNTFFPEDLKLISHWNLRDELKAQYANPDGSVRQEMIYRVMKRIISQEIPGIVVNNPDVRWNPYTNTVYKDGKPIDAGRENDIRYRHLLNTYRAMAMLDTYYPKLPSHIQRKFEMDREIPEATVEKLFTEFMSSPQVRAVGREVKKRLGRNLKPYDIWYDGFKSRSAIPEEKLDRIVRERYPDIKAFEADIPDILMKLGYTPEKARFIASRIVVDPARGAGHAWGAEMKSELSHLRTRVPENGMNYKGFNIAMHELGHNVEQTLTIQDVDHYSMHGVPNTAFTEAFAFVFQGKDLEVLGIDNPDTLAESMNVLDSLWAAYEIMGVSLVDMKVWRWLYDHPEAGEADLKQAVIRIAKEVWNRYYADVFGVKDEPILAVYSHMIDAALYLPDYPLGHLIEFQISSYLKGKNLGEEMPRMCRAGRLTPRAWMKNAVGSDIDIKPLLEAADEALKKVK